MNPDKLRAKLSSQRPDLKILDDEILDEKVSFQADEPIIGRYDVEDRDLSLSAWQSNRSTTGVSGAGDVKMKKDEVLSEDALRKMFTKRPLADLKMAQSGEGSLGIVRTVKTNSFGADTEGEVKD